MHTSFALIASAIIIAGSIYLSATAWTYVGYVNPDGTFYRLNQQTGAVQWRDKRSCIPVTVVVKHE